MELVNRTRLPSILAALVVFLALSVVNLVAFHAMNERNRIESRFEVERTFSVLFASLRSHDDFGSAIEATKSLKARILGLGLYDRTGSLLYRWGDAPAAYPPPVFDEAEVSQDMARMYLEKPDHDSMVLLLQAPKDEPPPPPPPPDAARGGPRGKPPMMPETFRKAQLIYLEVHQPRFWSSMRLLALLCPIVELAIAAVVSFVWLLVVKNREYRARIEQQKSLVTLGAVSSTLAHEIKNPLLAIRLQTSIIARTVPHAVNRELGIINCEVERLSSLSHHVNDFIRDPTGSPSPIDLVEIATEVGTRLCGRSIVDKPGGGRFIVRIDRERLRSILENLVRNALESRGKDDEVSIQISRAAGVVRIDVLDGGIGIPAADRQRVFDPFFTTKSRGSGIGLAICRRFVEAAGGSISIEERHHGGTRVRVQLPEVQS